MFMFELRNTINPVFSKEVDYGEDIGRNIVN